jgi:hypothetical protein
LSPSIIDIKSIIIILGFRTPRNCSHTIIGRTQMANHIVCDDDHTKDRVVLALLVLTALRRSLTN